MLGIIFHNSKTQIEHTKKKSTQFEHLSHGFFFLINGLNE